MSHLALTGVQPDMAQLLAAINGVPEELVTRMVNLGARLDARIDNLEQRLIDVQVDIQALLPSDRASAHKILALKTRVKAV